jgi:hypothetical protein
MATIIDALVVTLGFDTKGVKKGQADATDALKKVRDNATSTAKEMESRGAQAGQFFGQIRNQVIGLTAALLGGKGMEVFARDTTNSVAAMGRLAYNIGATVRDVGTFRNFVEASGGSADAAAASLMGLSQAMETYKSTGQASPEFLSGLGMIGADANTAVSQLPALFNKWAQNQTPQFRNQIGHWLGLDQGSIDALAQKSVAQFQAAWARAGSTVPSGEDAKKLTDLQNAWISFDQALNGVARTLLVDAAPALTKFLDAADRFIKDHPVLVEAAGGVATAFTGIGIAVASIKLGGLLSGLLGITGALRGLGTAAISLPAWMTGPGAFLYTMFHSTGLNKGEDEQVAKLNAGRGGGGSSDVMGLIRALEGSGDSAVSPKGAVGRYQIMPETARQYDPSLKNMDASTITDALKDPTFNEQIATKIVDDLMKRYHGDLSAVAVAYQSGPGNADKWIAGGKDDSLLGPQGRAYVAHERALTSGAGKFAGLGAGGGSTSSSTTNIQNLVVNSQADDASGIAQDIRDEIARQSNSGLN